MSEPDEAAAKRWTVEEWHEFPEWGEILTWPSDPPLRALVAEVDDEDDAGAIAAYAALVQAIRDAETLAKVRDGKGLRLPLPDLLMYLLTSPTDAQWREVRVDPVEVAQAIRAIAAMLRGDGA